MDGGQEAPGLGWEPQEGRERPRAGVKRGAWEGGDPCRPPTTTMCCCLTL